MAALSTRRTAFPFLFTSFPADVQLLILSNMNLHILQATTEAALCAKELYLKYPSSVLRGATATKGIQIQNLLLTTHSLVSTIKAAEVYPQPDLEEMQNYLAENLDTEKPRNVELVEYDALGVLHTLCEIDREVSEYVEDYADDIYERTCGRDNPGALPPPLVLSQTEKHRLTRAFYHLKLFGVLFYDYADRFRVDLESSHVVFFDRLSAFEIDELVTAYQFALRERRYFEPAYVHKGCSYSRSKPWTNSDPLNCKNCCGLYARIETGMARAQRRVAVLAHRLRPLSRLRRTLGNTGQMCTISNQDWSVTMFG